MAAIAKGANAIVTDLGVEEVDDFVRDIYYKVPQNVSFIKKERETVSTSNAITPHVPLQFKVPAYANCVYLLDRIMLELHLKMVYDTPSGPVATDGDLVGKQ
jgi:hypothetical protein